MEIKNFKISETIKQKIQSVMMELSQQNLPFSFFDEETVASISIQDHEMFGFIEFEEGSVVFLMDEKYKNRVVWECSYDELDQSVDKMIKYLKNSLYNKLLALEEKANLATKGNFLLKTKYGDSEPIEDQFNHGGYRTDTQLVVDGAFDQLNEKSYEEQNTPMKHRRGYESEEVLISEFKYRGPAQTQNNAEYFSMLDPEFVLQLIKLAKKEFEGK